MMGIFKKICMVSLSFTLSSTYAWTREFGTDLCKIDGHQISFKIQKTEGSTMILRAKHQLTPTSSLNFHFNPFYGIGASVYLLEGQKKQIILQWWNDFQEPTTEGSIVHDGMLIECAVKI